jgi:hypothetical protein
MLAAYGPVIRVAIPGWEDAVELHLHGTQWFSERGEAVTIEVCPATVVDAGGLTSTMWTGRGPDLGSSDRPTWLN